MGQSSHTQMAEIMSGERPARPRIWWGGSPHAVNCPIRTASISDGRGGNEPSYARTYKPRLPSAIGYCGGSDLGGEQTRRPEHERMTAAPLNLPYGSRCTDCCGEPSRSRHGEGRCPLGSNGRVHQRNHRGMGPSIWGKIRGDNAGKGHVPAGTCDNLHRPTDGGRPRKVGGSWSGA
jgi:hypothetical protein